MISGAYDRHSNELPGLLNLATNPDFLNGVEVASGRQVDGSDTFYKMVKLDGDIEPIPQSFAHNITGIDRVVDMYGLAKRDNAGAQEIAFAGTDVVVVDASFLAVEVNVIIIAPAAKYTGAGNTLSDLRIFLEYTKT